MAQVAAKKEAAAPAPKQPDMRIELYREGGGVVLVVDGKRYAPDVIDVVLAKLDMALRKGFQR